MALWDQIQTEVTGWNNKDIMCMCVDTQSCQTLWDSMDCSLSGSSVHGLLQTRLLEWVAISYSRESSDLVWAHASGISCIVRRILYHWASWEALNGDLQNWGPRWRRMLSQYLHTNNTFHTVHRILKARILKWFAIPFSSGLCFCQNSPLWSIYLGWPYMAWLIVSLS